MALADAPHAFPVGFVGKKADIFRFLRILPAAPPRRPLTAKTSAMELQLLRQQIDQLDAELLRLLNQRMNVVKQIGHVKQSQNAVIYRPEREKFIIERMEQLNDGHLNRAAIEAIFLEIFAVSRNLELPEKVAYLGPEGSFSHQAAESRFGAMSDYIPLNTIKSVFDSVETERVRFGVVPVENNQEGSVNETIEQLCLRNVNIVAEAPMSIHFTLASNEEKVGNIKRIYSKEIAFRQCKDFLHDYFGDNVALVPVTSTSKAAEKAAREPGTAALCSSVAARRYNLPLLFQNIEDSPNNRTRFLILSKEFMNAKSDLDKTTILAKIPDRAGALASFLQEFREQGINLCKIDSRPAKVGDQFKYWFLIEFEGHFLDENVQSILQRHAGTITLLGSYVKLC
jgi:chorismate mutase/prephenate dehydratase